MNLIDADEMLYELTHWKDDNGWHHDNRTDVYHISEIKMVCDRMPTVDAEERKKGKWEVQPSAGEDRPFIWWKCSECGHVIFSETERDRKEFHAFCGRCGAEMRGEANDSK